MEKKSVLMEKNEESLNIFLIISIVVLILFAAFSLTMFQTYMNEYNRIGGKQYMTGQGVMDNVLEFIKENKGSIISDLERNGHPNPEQGYIELVFYIEEYYI